MRKILFYQIKTNLFPLNISVGSILPVSDFLLIGWIARLASHAPRISSVKNAVGSRVTGSIDP